MAKTKQDTTEAPATDTPPANTVRDPLSNELRPAPGYIDAASIGPSEHYAGDA